MQKALKIRVLNKKSKKMTKKSKKVLTSFELYGILYLVEKDMKNFEN
jgi:hypothetical protein